MVSHLANLLTYKRYVMSGPSSASQAAQDATSPPPTPTSKLFAEYGAREIERVGTSAATHRTILLALLRLSAFFMTVVIQARYRT